eukprot:GHVT01096272.1.p1 GENE.GHVT01096272.1~~GHVT01096272.1.p1  ORF type:complete len:620 (+),score=51.52 GHVT01096272.1:322-2181(+)
MVSTSAPSHNSTPHRRFLCPLFNLSGLLVTTGVNVAGISISSRLGRTNISDLQISPIPPQLPVDWKKKAFGVAILKGIGLALVVIAATAGVILTTGKHYGFGFQNHASVGTREKNVLEDSKKLDFIPTLEYSSGQDNNRFSRIFNGSMADAFQQSTISLSQKDFADIESFVDGDAPSPVPDKLWQFLYLSPALKSIIYNDLNLYRSAQDRTHLCDSSRKELKELKRICIKNIADSLHVASGQGNIVHNKFNSLGKYPTTTDMFDMAKFVHHHLGIAPVTFADMTAMKVLPNAQKKNSVIHLKDLLSNMESNYSNLMADIYAGKGLTNLTPYTNAAVSSTLQYELETLSKKAAHLPKLVKLAKDFAPEAAAHIPGSWLQGHPTPSELLPSLFPLIPSFQAFDDIDSILAALPPHANQDSLNTKAAITRQLARRGIYFERRMLRQNRLSKKSIWNFLASASTRPSSSIADLAKAVRPIWEINDRAYMAQTVLIPNLSPAQAWSFAEHADAVAQEDYTLTPLQAESVATRFPHSPWAYKENGELKAFAGNRSYSLHSVSEAFLKYHLTHGPHGTIPSSRFQFNTSSLETAKFVPVCEQNDEKLYELMNKRIKDPFVKPEPVD